MALEGGRHHFVGMPCVVVEDRIRRVVIWGEVVIMGMLLFPVQVRTPVDPGVIKEPIL